MVGVPIVCSCNVKCPFVCACGGGGGGGKCVRRLMCLHCYEIIVLVMYPNFRILRSVNSMDYLRIFAYGFLSLFISMFTLIIVKLFVNIGVNVY